jgi:hypothetical protein
MSRAGVQVVDSRHFTFGCAMTWRALVMVVVAAALSAPLAPRTKLRLPIMRIPRLG